MRRRYLPCLLVGLNGLAAVLELHRIRGTHDDLRTLFKIEELRIAKGRKVAVVGANGCGKSTLLSYLSGRDRPKEGEIKMKPNAHVTVVEQNPTFEAQKTVLDTIYEHCRTATARAAHAFRAAQRLGGAPLAAALERMEELPEAWAFEETVEKVAEELVLKPLLQRTMGTLSGGEERRVALAAALIDLPQTDLLILDEPTNHLSAEGCEFLQETLQKATDVSVVLVSHDRYFLDRVCDEIFEIDTDGETFSHPGSWEAFLTRRAKRYEERRGELQDAKVQLRRAEEWARRGPQGRGTKNKAQMQAVEELRQQAMKVVSASQGNPDLDDQLLKGKSLEASEGSPVGRVDLKQVVVEVPQRGRVLNNISVSFQRGEKVGIVGPNGAGKSTMLKTLVGELTPSSGSVTVGQGVLMALLSQSPPAWPEPKRRVLDVVADLAAVADADDLLGTDASPERRRAQMLRAVNFAPSRWSTPVGMLSGGENRRLQLLRVLVQRPNCLLLDEPTNDLDAVTVDSLESMLQRYPGTLILVSHDRSLLDGVCSSFLVMQEDGSQPFKWPGSFQELLELQKSKSPSKQVVEKVIVKDTRKQEKRRERELQRLEQQISKMDLQMEEIDGKMSELWDQPEEVQKLVEERAVLEKQQAEAYERFEELMS